MRYQSAKGPGFAALVFGVILLLAVSIIIVPGELRITTAAGTALAATLLLWIWFGTWYEFREDELYLRYGPFFERIPYGRITEANRMKSMASSMALSSDMIELRHGENYVTGTTLISPKDRDGFLIELGKRCRNLKQNSKP